MSIVFASQIDFERAVMECLKEHLHLNVQLNKINMGQETHIKVALTSEYDGEITSSEDSA